MEIIWFFILIAFLLAYVAVVGAMIVRLVLRGGEGLFRRNDQTPPAKQHVPLRG